MFSHQSIKLKIENEDNQNDYLRPTTHKANMHILPEQKLMKLKIENEVLRKLHPHTFQTFHNLRGDIDSR